MKEGIDKRISLGGIVRNTAGSISPDGQMDEIINLRLKDGSFRPMSPNVPLDGIKDVNIDYTNIFIHTCDYRHWIGVKDGKLWYFANMDSSDKVNLITPVELMSVTKSDVQYSQVGNLLTVIDEDLNYIYWKVDSYVSIPVDYNGKQTDTIVNPDGLINFRMAPVTDKNGNARLRIYHGEGIGKDPSEALKLESVSALMVKALGVDAEKGNINGFFFACTALRLYDGTFILQSRPVLVAQNADLGSRYSYSNVQRYTTGTPPKLIYSSGSYESNYLNNQKLLMPNIIYKLGQNYASYDLITDFKNKSVEWSVIKNDVITSAHARAETNGFIQYNGGNNYETRVDINSPNLWGGLHVDYPNESTLKREYIPIAITSLGKLQYKVEKGLNKEVLSDIVESVCVFITNPVCMYDTEQWSQAKLLTTGNVENLTWENNQQVVLKVKTDAEIIDELIKSPNFYLVKEDKLNSIKEGDWVDIDLEKDAILKNLVQQEVLNLDSNIRNSYSPKTSFSYNGRLHIANYSEQYFRGFPLGYFFAQETVGGFPVNKYSSAWYYLTDEQFNTLKTQGLVQSYIAVELDTSDGKRTVVRYIDIPSTSFSYNWQSLSPFLSYPDNRATKMTICLSSSTYNYGGGVTQIKKTFPLKPHPYWNISYYFEPYIKPIVLRLSDQPSNKLEFKPAEKNALAYIPNGLKVSATDNPLYFPARNTYKVGNVEIVAMASNTIAVSTGQVGATPLYVFAKDGIYGLFVDASGEMTYTNSRPLSRDICNNPKSVTPIDDGIVFSSDRGLMILSGSEATRLSESAEGLFLDINGSDHFLTIVKKAISTTALVQLIGAITKEEFIDYIKSCVIGYNYKERELWVTNPSSSYSYILSGGLWVKRDITCREYINNYPNLYLLSGGQVLSVTKETTEGNEVMFLTRPIKFDTQEFKQAYRSVIRGVFELPEDRINVYEIDAEEVLEAPSSRNIILTEPLIEEITAAANTDVPDEVVIENTPLEPIVISSGEEKVFTAPTIITNFYSWGLPQLNMLDKKSIQAYTFANVPNGCTRLLNYEKIVVESVGLQVIICLSSNDIITLVDGVSYKIDGTHFGGGNLSVRCIKSGSHSWQEMQYDLLFSGSFVVPSDITTYHNDIIPLKEKKQYIELVDNITNTTEYFILDHTGFSISYTDLKAAASVTPFTVPLMVELQPNEQFVDWYYYGGQVVDGGRVVKYSGTTAASFNYFDLRSYPKKSKGNLLPANFSFVYNLDTTTLGNALDGSSTQECTGIISIKIDGVEKITSDFVYSKDARYLRSGSTILNKPITLAEIIDAKEVNNVINGEPVFDSYDESPLRYGYKKEGVNQTLVPVTLTVPFGWNTATVRTHDGTYYRIVKYDFWNETAQTILGYSLMENILANVYPVPPTYDNRYEIWSTWSQTYGTPSAPYNMAFILQEYKDNIYRLYFDSGFNIPSYATLSDWVRNGHWPAATPAIPASVNLIEGFSYVIKDTFNISHNIIVPEGGGGSIDYAVLMTKINEGFYETFYTLTDRVPLVKDKSYDFDSLYTFKFLGESTGLIALDIQTALESRANQGTVDYSNYGEVPLYYPESLTLTDGNGIHLTLPNLREYRFVYKGESVISSSELISRLNNGIYLPIPKTTFPNDNLTLVDERNYKFTDLNANVYTFKYDGASTINYDLLVDLLVNDMFDHVTTLADLTLNMTSGENVHLMVNYLTDPDYEKTFVYVGESTIAALTLIANAKNGVYADVPANNLSQVVFIPANQVIHFTDLNGVEYYLRTDIAEYISYSEFLNKLGDDYYEILDPSIASPYLAGIYVFGSYDAKKWQFLGGNEVGGSFRDLGALAERVDVKYFRILFVGNLKGNSSIEHIDMSVGSRLLLGKLR